MVDEKTTVEINKHAVELEEGVNQVKDNEIKQKQRIVIGTKVVRENFDEIVTLSHGDDGQQQQKDNNIMPHVVCSVENKEKGFSIQRAWCCLSRRTS